MRQLEKNGMNNVKEVIIQGVLYENCNCAHCLYRLPKCLPETAKAQEAYSATKKKMGVHQSCHSMLAPSLNAIFHLTNLKNVINTKCFHSANYTSRNVISTMKN